MLSLKSKLLVRLNALLENSGLRMETNEAGSSGGSASAEWYDTVDVQGKVTEDCRRKRSCKETVQLQQMLNSGASEPSVCAKRKSSNEQENTITRSVLKAQRSLSAKEDRSLDLCSRPQVKRTRSFGMASETEAEARLAARRAARAEAREIRMRELEKQQKEAEDDEAITPGSGSRGSSVSVRMGPRPASGSYNSSRRSSEDSTEDVVQRDTRSEFRDVDEKFRKAMISNAQLDNEKSTLAYQVDYLKDQLEDLEEVYNQQQRELKSRTSEYEQVKRLLNRLKEDNSILQAQLTDRDALIQEHGLVVVGAEGEEETKKALVSAQAAQLLQEAGEGSLDVRLKRFAEEKNELIDEIRRLKLDLEEERNKTLQVTKLSSTSGSLQNGPEMELMEVQREANKLISDYKFRLQKSEQENTTLHGNVARLESQVVRYKGAAESAEKAEDDLKVEKRKLQRELREAQARVEELETANAHLAKRLDKVKNARSMLLKEL